jgi:hypothetical protein
MSGLVLNAGTHGKEKRCQNCPPIVDRRRDGRVDRAPMDFFLGRIEIYRKQPVAAAAQCIFNIHWRSRAPGGRVISEFRHHVRRRAGDMVIPTSLPPPAGDTGIPASLRDPRARSRRSAPSVHRPGAEDARHRPPAGTAAQYNLEPCAMPPRITCARQPVPGRRAACFCYLVAVAGFS